MMPNGTVFLLQHEYVLEGHDEEKLLGVFSTRALAEDAQRYFETQVGFKDHLEGFSINECPLDTKLWSEGFITVRYPWQKEYPTS